MFLLQLSDDVEGARWSRWRIPDDGVSLLPGDANGSSGVVLASGRDPRAAVHLVPFVENGRESAALVVAPSPSAVFVDGRPPLGVTVLDERAELVLGGARLYFTGREPLEVTRHVGEGESCALCGDALEGALVIACSGCGAVTHEGKLADGRDLLCFSHHGRCPRCLLRREDFAWTPAEGD